MKWLRKLLIWLHIVKNPNRKYPSDVKANEYIKIQYHRSGALDEICSVQCLSNDIQKKKMLVRIHWDLSTGTVREEYEDFIISYNGYCLKNFNLLNSQSAHKEKKKNTDTIESLEKEIKDAMEKEEYMRVTKLQKKLDKLKNKDS